jgi:hypothetical protein
VTDNNVIFTFENKCTNKQTNKQTNETRGSAMAQALRRRSLRAECLFPSIAVHVKLAIYSVPLGMVPVRVLLFLPVSVIPHSINAPCSFNVDAI